MAVVIPVFIASPSDVQKERLLVKSAIGQLSPRLHRLFGVALSPVDWLEFAPEASESRDKVFEDRILDCIVVDSLFVGIIYKRLGTPIADNREITGTEAEYDYAIDNRQRIKILTYIRKVEEVEVSQLKVARLRNRIVKEAQLPYQEYRDEKEFANRILLDLMEAVLGLLFASENQRRRQYTEFFRFGTKRGSSTSNVLVVYPPIHKHDLAATADPRPDYDWRSRLVPNVVYEDFKTIQKLEGALRLIGVSEYRSVTTLYPAVDVDHGNRIWICIPRNPPARMELKELGNRVRFTFVNKNEGDESKLVKCVEWRHSNGDTVLARSPLAKYLSQARPAGRRPWDPAFGYIYAKDYAVISRFRLQNPNAHPGKPYYHYFIAGIRGLGTWGAGWYIDRFPDELEKFSKLSRGGDVQILLEVTYCNYRVIAVTDVSDKSQDYFDKEYSNEVIQGHLKRSDNAKRFVRRGKQPKIVNP